MAIKLHSGYMEVAVANLLNPRIHTIAPNISWGLGFKHECDLLVLDVKGRFTEVEIKISMADLKKDFEKPHGHFSPYIGRLVYAIPLEMLPDALPLIPPKCGIITVARRNYPNKYQGPFKASWYKQCLHRKDTELVPDWMREKFYQLAAMRIWSLKLHNYKSQLK